MSDREDFYSEIRGWDWDDGEPQQEYERLYTAWSREKGARDEARAAACALLGHTGRARWSPEQNAYVREHFSEVVRLMEQHSWLREGEGRTIGAIEKGDQ